MVVAPRSAESSEGADGHANLGVKLEAITPGALVGGIDSSGPVAVVAVRPVGHNAIMVTFETASGRLDKTPLYREHEPSLWLAKASAVQAFDGDGALFRLAAEALRIRLAALFDPMLAVSTSGLDPLPHQIKAVYGELLPRTPLRFLLADDPGAGKTIMAGLYIKELLLRGDLARCLIVAPGSLVEQWQEELYDKFGLSFDLLTRPLIDAAALRGVGESGAGVFETAPLLIARMDQLSRSDELRDQLKHADWDLVVVDEAHRMSAHYFGAEFKPTKRYQLGQLLGQTARHLLLMTATPHAGKEEDFQLFLALLDADRFEGRFRDGVHSVDTGGLMRRMVKEKLLKFDGTPLFPERVATTVSYQLSPLEAELYESVTQYVREEMNRADRLSEDGDGRRRATVGFALTVLQRRLASSPEAILRSLERRRRRLEQRRREMAAGALGRPGAPLRERLDQLLGRVSPADLTGELEEYSAGEVEELEENVVDAATAARTLAELDVELGVLDDLVEIARRVRAASEDRKWNELRALLLDDATTHDRDGNLHKIIIFTEHRDTLDYLVDQICALLGSTDVVVAIHGGVRREDRRRIQEIFTQEKDCRVLIATDAAGEGLNLQRAHLMVNYDLPWNPNKIEQRFGRIHRIGQTEVCQLWNLVAEDTREGDVFRRLLDKIEQQRRAYQGEVFDVLGEAFEGKPLRDLLLEAIRYGDRPETRARLFEVIDERVGEGLDQLLEERALHRDVLGDIDLNKIRLQMEEARLRRLQPYYVQAFFAEAFKLLGGRIAAREKGRFEIRHVPAVLRERDRQIGTGAPVLHSYERVTFEQEYRRIVGKPPADLLAPGHPLVDAVIDVMIERHSTLLRQGAILVDRNDRGDEPRLLVAVAQEIRDGHEKPRTVSKRFDFVEIRPDGRAKLAGPAPYLDYEAPDTQELPALAAVHEQAWLTRGVERIAEDCAVEHGGEQLREARERIQLTVGRQRAHVRQRLLQEINYWDIQHNNLLELESAGRSTRIRPETAERRARDLEARLERRLAELVRDEHLTARPPTIAGGALVVPQGLVDRLLGRPATAEAAVLAQETAAVERRAVSAVLAAERALGRDPEEMPHNNPGYDIRSRSADGSWVFLEVKGRIAGADDFTVTRNEVLHGRNAGGSFRLALVRVHPDGPSGDEVRYIPDPFAGYAFGAFATTRVQGNWQAEWTRGGPPC